MSKQKQTLPKLPKEAVRFAKSMGLDLDGLEPEAEDIWKMLDEMSNANPMQYEQFVAEQLRSAKDDDGKKTEGSDKRSFRPTAGYCVQTNTIGGDGLKIRDVSSSQGKKFFINLCSSVVIEEPTDNTGKPIQGTRSVADGLSIPLIVGPVRGSGTSFQSTEKDMFVDVVVHPRVLELATGEAYFKAQIVDLALDWVIKESSVDCNRKWEHVKSTSYKGGRGENSDIPVLFFVDSNGAPVGQADTMGADSSGTGGGATKVMSSTASLLSQLHQERSGEQAEAQEKVDIFSTKPFCTSTATTKPSSSKPTTSSSTSSDSNSNKKLQKPLIQEIGVPAEIYPSVDAVDPKAAEAQAAKSSDKTLKTKADTSSKVAADSMPPAPPPPPSVNSAPAVPVPAPTVPVADKGKAAEPTKMEYLGMERLLSSFDEEFSSAPCNSQTEAMLMDIEGGNSMMESLAKVLSGNFSTDTTTSQQSQQKQEKNDRSSSNSNSSLPGRESAVHSATNSSDRSKGTEKDGYLLRNDAPEAVSLTVQVEEVRDELAPSGKARTSMLVITVANLSSNLDTSAMELLVSKAEVLITLERRHLAALASTTTATTGTSSQKLSFGAKCVQGQVLREASATAAFKKKKGTLVVKIQLSQL